MNISGKVIAVTGAASGLGKATVDALMRTGAKVIAIDLRDDFDIPESWIIDNVLYTPGDVTRAGEMEEIIRHGAARWGSIHGAVACAGIAPARKLHSSRHGSHPAGEFMKVLEVNLGGTFHLFNSCVPYMKNNPDEEADGEKGVLIATSSVAAFEGQIGQTAYAASKGGVASMILPMARELAGSGIRVNAIAPGIFETPMVAGFSEEVRESLAASIPFPTRLGHPEEFARLVEHLLTNPYINGTVLRLDGGVRMR